MNLKSIRWQLPLSYAGIALLAAVVLGTILILTLRDYYNRQEQQYLIRNAQDIQADLVPALKAGAPPEVLEAQIKNLAFFAQARVRLLDPAGNVVLDSGLPSDLNVLTFSPFTKFIEVEKPVFGQEGPVERFRFDPGGRDIERFPAVTPIPPASPGEEPASLSLPWTGAVVLYSSPALTDVLTSTSAVVGGYGLVARAPDTLFYFNPGLDADRSQQEVEVPVFLLGPKAAGRLLISDSPAYGRQIVESVARAWALASLIAVLLAGGAGWLVSRRVTAPLSALTGVTARMAQGDLSVRAESSSGDEFGELGQSFNEMASRVEEMVLALRRFVSDAAHELQTPLTALRTNLELAGGDSGAAAVQYLERAQDQVERLSSLTQDLLDLSRLEAGARTDSWEEVNLSELAQRVSEIYAARSEQRGQEFVLRLPAEALHVSGSPAQLERLLGNLLDNALKFTPPGGRITLGLDSIDGENCLWVEDTGIGIPPEEIGQLFGRFHRGRNASAYPGSGLGLAIVKAIAEAHGGRVQVENRPGGGTRFTLCLGWPLPRG